MVAENPMAVATDPHSTQAAESSGAARADATDTYRPVRIWLWCVAALVFLMVFVGGATRLTDSGLSITEWRPITGVIPPLTAEGWETELEKYRQIPEYQRINRGMSMAEFQFIYWWEWGHRFLGRLVGLAFVVPLVWFAARKALPPRSMPKLLGLLALGGLQGFIGWWMVASGLVDRVDVSQYRLGVHLTMAAIILAAIAWVAQGMKPLEARLEERRAQPAVGSVMAGLFVLFVLFQIFLGALVAGLDAGLTYTTWPLMDGDFIPPMAKLFIQSRGSPIWAKTRSPCSSSIAWVPMPCSALRFGMRSGCAGWPRIAGTPRWPPHSPSRCLFRRLSASSRCSPRWRWSGP